MLSSSLRISIWSLKSAVLDKALQTAYKLCGVDIHVILGLDLEVRTLISPDAKGLSRQDDSSFYQTSVDGIVQEIIDIILRESVWISVSISSSQNSSTRTSQWLRAATNLVGR